MSIVRVSRGVEDPQACASFLSSLFALRAEEQPDGIRVGFANGEVLFHDLTDRPVAIGLLGDRRVTDTEDPDGVPVFVEDAGSPASAVDARIDHIRLNCADLPATVAFYRQLGFRLTWAGNGDETLFDGDHEELISEADWVHLSSRDGYLSVSQADWLPYGAGLPAVGPPRFLHVGFAVPDLAVVEDRLATAGIKYFHPEPGPLGRQIYLNDPNGDPAVGNNVEIFCYESESQTVQDL